MSAAAIIKGSLIPLRAIDIEHIGSEGSEAVRFFFFYPYHLCSLCVQDFYQVQSVQWEMIEFNLGLRIIPMFNSIKPKHQLKCCITPLVCDFANLFRCSYYFPYNDNEQ
jgi:hypothetical protein